ncbi:unnamed protein product [Cuscuta epithymum]|uniref:Uncharacterized protein n=1 Tax=Cuscuta epithymum TaxID=186058 RepID=A0AAV0EF55_9ASTE|nr:unnamed protein product [Cuscuta epithymum]
MLNLKWPDDHLFGAYSIYRCIKGENKYFSLVIAKGSYILQYYCCYLLWNIRSAPFYFITLVIDVPLIVLLSEIPRDTSIIIHAEYLLICIFFMLHAAIIILPDLPIPPVQFYVTFFPAHSFP